jgi:hypothetical protein
MRTLMILAAGLALTACATSDVGGPQVVGGVASYDALKNARAACVAKGAELVLNEQNSGKRLSDYACKRK